MKSKTLLLTTLFNLQLYAQKSITVSSGIASVNYFKHLFLYGLNFFGTPPITEESFYSINLTYKNKKKKKVYAAFNFGYENLFGTKKYETGSSYKLTVESIRATTELYYKYKSKRRALNYYGFLGLGLESNQINRNDNYIPNTIKRINVAWQLTPIGFDFKMYKQWLGAFEFGFGYKGAINFGIQYHFK